MPHGNCPRFPSFSECSLRYNIADSEREPDELLVHQTEANIPPIGDEEHSDIMDAVSPVVARHNQLHGFPVEWVEGCEDHYFMVAEMWNGDRTIEVCTYGEARYTRELVLDLQSILRGKLRLWRIQLMANTRDDAILVYPESIRNSDAPLRESLSETLNRVNAHIQSWERRHHRYCCQPMPDYRQPDLPPRLVDARVVYNSDNSNAFRQWPLYRSAPDTEEPSVEEYLEFEEELLPAIERHGPVVVKDHLSDTTKERDSLFWLIRTTEMQWDRTRILVRYGQREFTDELISDIQDVLKRWPLWRVALDAEEAEDVRFIYPDFIR